MSLTAKMVAILTVLVLVQAAIDYVAQQRLIMPHFQELERDWARADIARCLNIMNEELRQLGILCEDWAAWDDTYEYVATGDPDYVRRNLVESTFADSHLDLVFICDVSGKVVYGRALAPGSTTATVLPEFPPRQLPQNHPALLGGTRGRTLSGVMMTGQGPMLLVARTIRRSDTTGPSRGTLIMGRYLTASVIDRWSRQTGTQLRISVLDGHALDPRSRWALVNLQSRRDFIAVADGGDHVHIFRTVADLGGKPALLVRVGVPRTITKRGHYVGKYAILTAMYRGLLVLAAVVVLMRHIVIAPVQALGRQVRTVRETGDLTLRSETSRTDELGFLAREFDQMLSQLADAQQALATRSRELQVANSLLEQDIERRKETEERLIAYQSQLRSLAADLATTEDRERRELADVLHDGVSQMVATAKMRVEALESGDTGADLADDLHQISHLLEQAIREARSLTFELSPPVLRELGLSAAISWLIDTPGCQGLSCRLRDDGAPKPLDDDVAAAVFKAVRELLTNVIKHAQAETVTIDLRTDGPNVRVEVADDGIGLPEGVRPVEQATGFGLLSINERIRRAGGSLEIVSEPGQGVRAILTAPLRAEQNGSGEPNDDPSHAC